MVCATSHTRDDAGQVWCHADSSYAVDMIVEGSSGPTKHSVRIVLGWRGVANVPLLRVVGVTWVQGRYEQVVWNYHMNVARVGLIKSQVWSNYSVDAAVAVWPHWQPDFPLDRYEWLASAKLDLWFVLIRALVTPCKTGARSYKRWPISLNLAAFKWTYWIPEYEELLWHGAILSSGRWRSGREAQSQGVCAFN